MRTTTLGPAEREAALARMAEEELNILVVGGGVVGAGTALDSVTRGLSTGLVGQGLGVRHLQPLQQADPRRSALSGDARLQPRAGGAQGSAACCWSGSPPHLVKPVPFLYPLQHKGWERFYAGSGVALYDAHVVLVRATAARTAGLHRHLGRVSTALAGRPGPEDRTPLVGAHWQYYDAPDGRRALTSPHWSGRPRPTAPRSPTGRGWSASCARANAWSVHGCRTWRAAASTRSGPSRS